MMSVDGYHPDELAAIIDVANRYRLNAEIERRCERAVEAALPKR